MIYQHKELSLGKWGSLTFFEQMANIGSEVGRAIAWRHKGNNRYSREAAARALELLFLTIDNPQDKKHLKELTRLRETLVDYFFGQNRYGSSADLWQKYFYAFNYAARLNKA